MLLEEDNADNGLVLILVILPWLDLLQELSCIAAVLPDEARCIPHKELPALVSELAGSNVGVVAGLVEFGEDLLEGACDVIVDADVVGGEEEDVVGHRADLEVEDNVKLVNLL